jgi:hypothetical protein
MQKDGLRCAYRMTYNPVRYIKRVTKVHAGLDSERLLCGFGLVDAKD